jgi:hypothetical protein
MEDPDDLPRSMDYTLFAARASQALEMHGQMAQLPSVPPKGKLGDKAILIHLVGYKDWRARSPDMDSLGTSSEHGSPGPMFIPFPWMPGVLDGRPPTHRAPPPPTPRRDHDDGTRGPQPHDDNDF